jgi:hypothetical protein
MFNALKTILQAARRNRDLYFYDRLRQEEPVRTRRVNLDQGTAIIKNFLYNHIVCPDSAGYISLEADGPNLRVSGICEKDYNGPRLEDAVFINGERLRPFGYGECAELIIPRDSRIFCVQSEFVPNWFQSYWKHHLVQIVPFSAAW